MRGISRESQGSAAQRLESLLSTQDAAGAAQLGDDLFGITGALAGNPGLRRALTDPSRGAEAKVALVSGLFAGKVSPAALDLFSGVAGSRWSAPGDLVDATENLAVQTVLAGAEKSGRLDAVEDELFRFGRTVAGDQSLRDAFSARTEGDGRKAALVERLLGGKAAPETVRLAVQAAAAPRGLRTERVLESYVEAAAERRRQLVAEVIVAQPLTDEQRARLTAALLRIYDRPVRLNVDVDPSVVGGIRVSVGGEIIDGSVSGRLDQARRKLAG